jgi:Ca2+-transporting ATPase
VLDSDATVGDDGSVIGDPTEAALVVLAAKLGVDADQTRNAYPRLAEVPFDSDYKFMATFHKVEIDGAFYVVELVKGAPDVVLGRCSMAGGPFRSPQLPIEQERDRIEAANRQMGQQGLRVLAFAARLVPDEELPLLHADPMSLTTGLGFVGMVGIIDPLRPSAKVAVETALRAGIDVRMITGDHAVTAHAIGESLGLGVGAISGAELQALSDEELRRRLPALHVFGRVTPEDKLRLARIMQGEGMIVAMTGDAVNDAAALKQADIGVAMGSGSEVSKQAARMILTDDNFGTLVHAVALGRSIYGKVVSYIRYQMSQLLSLVLLFVTATLFNINSGVAMTPLMVLFLNFFVAIFPVVVIMLDPADPEIMNRPPRDPKVAITNQPAVVRWVAYGAVLFLMALIPLVLGPDEPFTDRASASMTMCYVVVGLGTIFSGVVMRRDPTSGLTPPILTAVKWSAIPAALLILSTELAFLQHGLLTQSLTGLQWLACIGLGLVMPLVVELDKWLRRRRQHPPAPVAVEVAVAPSRAVAPA